MEQEAGVGKSVSPSPAIPEDLSITIAQLSSSSFELREQATERLSSRLRTLSASELSRIGSAALDLEGQIRLTAAVSKIKEERLQANIKSFLRAKNPKDTFGFDGWSSFSRYSGTSRNAKRIFLDLLDNHPDLVEKPLISKEQALEKAKSVLTDIAYKRGQLLSQDKSDGLAALYCINASEELYESRLERVSIMVFQTAPFTTYSLTPEFKRTIDPMLERWGKQVKKELLNRESAVACEIGQRVLASNAVQDDPDAFVIAMQAIFRHGKKEDLVHVLKWFDDETVCTEYPMNMARFGQNPRGQRFGGGFGPGGSEQEPGIPNGLNPIPMQRMQPIQPGMEREQTTEVWTVEYRDVALLVAIQLSGGDVLEEFPLMRSHPLRGFYDQTIGLPKDQKELRKARIIKWQAGQDQPK
jgi:hypothetical protein